MAVVGTQTTKYETGGPYTHANVFTYNYPAKAVYPGGSGSSQAIVTEAAGTGGGISVYTR